MSIVFEFFFSFLWSSWMSNELGQRWATHLQDAITPPARLVKSIPSGQERHHGAVTAVASSPEQPLLQILHRQPLCNRTPSLSWWLMAGWGRGNDGARLSPSAPAQEARWICRCRRHWSVVSACGLRPNRLNPISTHLNLKLDKPNPTHFSSKPNPTQ
jgi:hypothetical protein